eukprot:RCo026612
MPTTTTTTAGVGSSPAQYFEQQLRRKLTDDELELVTQLTPRGVAKINADMCRGVPAESTLRCLQLSAFHLKELQRRQRVQALPRTSPSAVEGSSAGLGQPHSKLGHSHVLAQALSRWWHDRFLLSKKRPQVVSEAD